MLCREGCEGGEGECSSELLVVVQSVWGPEEGGQGRASLLDVVGGVPVRRLQENTSAEREGRVGSTSFVLD